MTVKQQDFHALESAGLHLSADESASVWAVTIRAMCLTVASLYAGVSTAADTEIYFANPTSTGQSAANIMFMFDTSGSMRNQDGVVNGPTRINRVRQAMIDVVESAGNNVNIGVGAFNGGPIGGAILLPTTNVEADLCPDATCTSHELRAELKQPADDAEEDPAGVVELSSTSLYFLPSTNAYYDGSDLTASVGENIAGFRFDDLNIPRGATINYAALEFAPTAAYNDAPSMIIVGQDTDDAAVFESVQNNLSNRISSATERTSSFVAWNPGASLAFARERSSDISSIVKEIVDRPGWCGGNAMALFMWGDSQREIASREGGPWDAPVLRVDYDPSSVDFSDTCLRKSVSALVQSGTDDIVQSVVDGSLDAQSDSLKTHSLGAEQFIGIRFHELSVPQGAQITDAYIQLTSAGFVTGNIDLEIDVHLRRYAWRFDTAVANTVTARNFTGTPVIWNDVPEVDAGNSMRTPSLTSLVQRIVNIAGWSSNKAMAFVFKVPAGSTGERLFSSIDSPTGASAKLVVNYQMDGTALAGQAIPLKTAREEIIKTMLDLPQRGSTPLVDAYYEASQYMRGADVVFGKQRGQQIEKDRIYRVSHPGSYENGTLYQPPGCETTNLGNVACFNEEIQGSPSYIQPEFGECQANQIVLLSDGQATSANGVSSIQAATSQANCATRTNQFEQCGVELAQWMFDTDHDAVTDGKQSIITHTVGFNFESPFLQDLATAGGGGYHTADSASDLTQVFRNIIDTAVSLDTSFVAPTATVSQTNRLVNSNDIYYGMFKPETKTLWDGNLKRYQLAKNSTTGLVEVLDALAVPAVDPASGGIISTAKSFWSGSADGSAVAEGGAAEQMTLSRDLYVSLEDATTGVVTGLSTFHEDTVEITNDLLGIVGVDEDYRADLLKWARGVDIKDIDQDGNISEVRAQMGDPLHSTQFLLTYVDSAGDTKTIIFVSTNQGFLHAINTDDGTEEFAYIPQDLLNNLNHFYRDDAISHDKRPYGLDGEVSGWHDDTNKNGMVDAGEEAYIYLGMRRGGRDYYALDVSDLDSPDFQWKIEGGQGDFAELGQTWSRAIKSRVRYNGVVKDVLIFAGGYDDDKDDQTIRATDDQGAAIFMVDAKTGVYLTSRDSTDFTDMRYSIPSDLRVINLDSDGFADMIWVGDTGGQVWRFDIDNLASSDNDFLRGAVAADFGNVGATQNRRFFYEPDIALIKGPDSKLYMNIGIGSGFRAHPNDVAVEDRFYSFRTTDVFSPPTDNTGVIDYSGTKLVESDLVNVSTQSGTADTTNKISAGWFFNMPDTGEKVLSSALTVDNVLSFTTYVPAATSSDVCSVAIGGGRVYSVDAFFGDPTKTPDPTDPTASVDLVNDRYTALKTPGIPPRVTGLIAESNPNAVTQLVGLESVSDAESGAPFERTFWAEQ